jgi:hypothetical protein
MRGYWPIIYFSAIAVAAISISCWGTRVLWNQSDLPQEQRRWQLLLTWIVPVIGALLVIEMHRPSRRLRRSKFVTADEINPMVNQALQPLAQDATRAAEGFIEQEILDATLEHFTDSGADAGHGDGGSH